MHLEAQAEVLHEALKTTDTEAIHREAHKIRRGAGSMTAMPLAEAAGEIEGFCELGRLDQLPESVAEFEKEFRRLKIRRTAERKGGPKGIRGDSRQQHQRAARAMACQIHALRVDVGYALA